VAKYKLQIKPSAAKELKKLPKTDLQTVIKKIQSLSSDPRPVGCEKLSGEEKYRIRQGNYRVVYSIEDDKLIIFIVKIGHRRDIYKNK